MPVKLDELEGHLKAISRHEWQRLFDLNNQIEPGMNFGQVKGGDHREDGSFADHYWERSEIVQRFHDLVYELGLVIDFNWPKWQEGKDLLESREQHFDHLDVVTLCKLMTTIVRADRFNEGFLIRCFEDGTISDIVHALEHQVKGD